MGCPGPPYVIETKKSLNQIWGEAVLAARSASNIASGSLPAAPDSAREMLQAMENWTHTKKHKT